MQEEIKSIDFQLDDEAEGKVSAVFSVFNNLDSDGDVVVPGAIKSKWDSGMVPMVWAHKWDMPIGKGYIKEEYDFTYSVKYRDRFSEEDASTLHFVATNY